MNVLFTSSQSYTIKLASLFSEKGWNPLYFFTSPSLENKVHEHFPEAVTHDYIHAVKGIPAPHFKDLLLNELDPAILDFLSSRESVVLSMMDRNDSNSDSFLYRDRLEFYYYLIRYWQTVLKKLNISIVVFEEEPHQANDYVLYLVCEVLGIKTLMTVRTISNLGLIPMEKFEIGCLPFLDLYKKAVASLNPKASVELPEYLDTYYKKLTGTYDSVISEHLWDQVDKVKDLKNKPNPSLFSVQIKMFLSKMFDFSNHYRRLSFIINDEYISDQKEKGKSIYNSRLGYFQALIYKRKTIKVKSNNRDYYNSVSIDVIDTSKPYIFCGLQYQPEKSTCPLGGRFVNQILMVELIAKNLPAGWNLYVKEHPSQFVFDYTRYGDLFRNREYYERIRKIPNTYLLSLKTDVFKIIDGSEGVASVTGTICWEAAMRGKISLNFGHSWLKGCEGIFEIFTKKDLVSALSLIKDKHKIDVRKVQVFGKVIDGLGFKAAVGGQSQLEHRQISIDENAQIHFNAYNWLLNNSNAEYALPKK
jgi:hypothetical protein